MRLLDLHQSDPFSPETKVSLSSSTSSAKHLIIHTNGNHSSAGSGSGSVDDREETMLPEGWVSRDVQHESMLLCTRMRDIHDAGVVLM